MVKESKVAENEINYRNGDEKDTRKYFTKPIKNCTDKVD